MIRNTELKQAVGAWVYEGVTDYHMRLPHIKWNGREKPKKFKVRVAKSCFVSQLWSCSANAEVPVPCSAAVGRALSDRSPNPLCRLWIPTSGTGRPAGRLSARYGAYLRWGGGACYFYLGPHHVHRWTPAFVWHTAVMRILHSSLPTTPYLPSGAAGRVP